MNAASAMNPAARPTLWSERSGLARSARLVELGGSGPYDLLAHLRAACTRSAAGEFFVRDGRHFDVSEYALLLQKGLRPF